MRCSTLVMVCIMFVPDMVAGLALTPMPKSRGPGEELARGESHPLLMQVGDAEVGSSGRSASCRKQMGILAGVLREHPEQGAAFMQEVSKVEKALLAQNGRSVDSIEAMKAHVRESAQQLLQLSQNPLTNVSCVSDPRYAPYGCPVDPLLDIDLIWDANNYLEEFIVQGDREREAYTNSSSNTWDPSSYPVTQVARDWAGLGPHFVEMPDFILDRYANDDTTTTTTTTTPSNKVNVSRSYSLAEVDANTTVRHRSVEDTVVQVDHTIGRVVKELAELAKL
mmetsp:Transcript_44501/g.105455  ORF Transcript_44501/g.105455 Transcript_44501/m.105455 type:complete len:280 (+) Transcript_44501:105-944(+)